jgi:Zn finger protein HypA/HybF involved in hydrogenase expression
VIVRCGACRTQFDVPGPGRFACPACGSVNQVRSAPGGPPSGPAGAPPYSPPPPPPRPDPPSPKISCPECEFSFIVGKIELATCPNCGAEVETGWKEAEA